MADDEGNNTLPNVNKPLLDSVDEQPTSLIDEKLNEGNLDTVTAAADENDAVTNESDVKAEALDSEVTEVEAINVSAGAESVILSKSEGNDEAVAEENVSMVEGKMGSEKDGVTENKIESFQHDDEKIVRKTVTEGHVVSTSEARTEVPKDGAVAESVIASKNEGNNEAIAEGNVSIYEAKIEVAKVEVTKNEETEPDSVFDDSKVLDEPMGAEVDTEINDDVTELKKDGGMEVTKQEVDTSQSIGNEENAVTEGVFSATTDEEVGRGSALDDMPVLPLDQENERMGVEGETANTDAEEAVENKVEENDEMAVDVEMDATKHEEVEHDDSQGALLDEEDEEAMGVEEEETTKVDTEMETETDTVESGKASGGKRKRRNSSKSPGNSKAVSTRATSRKTTEEDVCFICFDGGDLVLCDRRGCPKAYHPSCVNRDEAFFRAKGRWNCGWHLCSICEKNAYYMCYTCTFSLCKGCIKDAVILCIRGNKGFCETCMKTVKLIESNGQWDKDAPVDFDDKSCWEYLFKDYFVDLKTRLSLSSEEIANAKSPWKKGSDESANKHELADPQYEDNDDDGASHSDESIETLEASKTKRRSSKRRSKSFRKEEDLASAAAVSRTEGFSTAGTTEWASKELLDFVKHMKNGDASVISQFDVQALLLEYIKTKKLRDPRRKSQIICDSRLERLFGKPRVGHFEMLKLLESHFLVKEDSQTDDVQGSVVDTEVVNHFEADTNADTPTSGVKDRKRKRKKGERRGPQSNLEDYAAINVHNIGLIYLRRKLFEDLLGEIDKFHDKVVGTFVRIRISGSAQKQELYRLVQVVGTSKAAEPYKIGKRTTDIVLEILNLNKTEVVSIDTVSNQDFTEEECKRLRQSIKCGLINRLTVGDILDKAMEIHAARVDDWLESEILRLSHLRDRASEKGRKKELRECVEKLQLLKTPDERHRRLDEIPEIHADPNMDPSYESEDDDGEKEIRQDVYTRSREFSSSRRGRGPVSPQSNFSPKDPWGSAGKSQSKYWESNCSLSSKNISSKDEDAHAGKIANENAWSQGKDSETESKNLEKLVSSPAPLPVKAAETAVVINETEKIWHYKDPSGKIQGPFSMVQLRKWNNTGYFPADLKIWRATEKEDESILLTDALAGRFQKDSPPVDNVLSRAVVQNRDSETPHVNRSHGSENSASLSVSSTERWSNSGSFNLPSPTPKQDKPGSRGHSIRGLESNVSSGTDFGPVPNSGEGLTAGSTNPMQHTQSTATNEQHAAVMNSQPASHGATVHQSIQSLNIQNPNADAHSFAAAAGGANVSVPVPGQHQGYGNWLAPSVQNSSVSFSGAGASVVPQPDYWTAQTQGGQPNVQLPSVPTVAWGVGLPENINSASVLRPENPNNGWSMMPGNPNMTWSGQVPAAMNMNWGSVQAMPAGSANPGLVVPTVPVPGNMNQAWVAPSAGWVAPTANMGSTVQGPMPVNGWATGPGNPGTPVQGPPPGDANANQGWRPSTGSQGTRNNEHHRDGGNFSGRMGEGSHGGNSGYNGDRWNRQSSFGPGGFSRGSSRKRDTPCPYYAKGRCIKGSRCDYLHS